jgi:PAS domain S-box-containing protein
MSQRGLLPTMAMLKPKEPHRAHPTPPLLTAILRASESLLDLLPVATFVCDAAGTILQYNSRAVEIWGREPDPGDTHESFSAKAKYYETDGTPTQTSLLATVLATGLPVRDAERRVERPDGSTIVVAVNIEPLRNARGDLIGAVHCMVDVSDRERMTAALEESRRHAREQEQRLAATYEHAAIGIAEVTPEGHFVRVNEAICAITGRSREELMGGQLFRFTHESDVDADRQAFRKQVAGELQFYSMEKRFRRPDGRVIWISIYSSPVRAPNGSLLYLVRVVQDITERKQAELRQKLLVDELNHRVKNTLATVQSLASQTARSTANPKSFSNAFEGRLIALSKAHDQLTRHHWENAELRELLSGSLAPYAAAAPERVVLRGEDLVLRPRAVLTLAMVVHELTTNAAKYGALSVAGGRVEVRWEATEQAGRKMLRLDWSETGGPEVKMPERRSFGSRLIEGSIKAELGGTAKLIYAPDGLRCEMRIPWSAAAAG